MTEGHFARSLVGISVFSLAAILAPASIAQTTSPAPSPQLLESLQALDTAWDAAPLGFTAATFVKTPASGYGQFEALPSNIFDANDPIHVYAEPVGYGFAKTSGGYIYDLEVSFRLLNTTGQILAEQSGFARFSGETEHRKRELPTSLSFQFEGLPAGNYVLETTYGDKVSNKAGTVALPLVIQAAD
jgi:hypothetical protein